MTKKETLVYMLHTLDLMIQSGAPAGALRHVIRQIQAKVRS